MAVIAVSPFVMKNATFTVAADNYTAALSSVVFTPSASAVTFKGLTPTAVFTDTTTATWTVDLGYAQDWATANSLSKYLFTNEGSSVTAVFSPIAAGATITATIKITPGAIGGAVDGFATATVSLAVVGKPVIA